MFEPLDRHQSPETGFLELVSVLAASFFGFYFLGLVAAYMMSPEAYSQEPSRPPRPERRLRSFRLAEKRCAEIMVPEESRFVRSVATPGDDDVWTVTKSYRTSRPAPEIRAFFLAMLRRSANFDGNSAPAVITLRQFVWPEKEGGGEGFELVCRGTENPADFGIYDISRSAVWTFSGSHGF